MIALTGAASTVLLGCSAGNDGGDGGYQFTEPTPAATVLPAKLRAPAPSFSGELLDRTPFSSKSLDGDIVLINFWGSWCTPCRVETPELQAVYTDVADRGVQFLGIDVKDERQLAAAFVETVGATYASLFDPRGEVALTFRGFPANVVPSTILLDRQGRVAAVYTGQVSGGDVRTAIGLLLDEGTP
ncbi:TlpA disulfide reductase family protein [Modestobacter sp. DSM 44400]|uniref:TlpA family protein disulfide reductase n=1 Tax=Modestobacter sp. DSM 44400 TaxID=1550230 RepID=UPI0020C878C9|nr:TlpA disulfide reductase family protein [Modestobacter sp. DSM 44400]